MHSRAARRTVVMLLAMVGSMVSGCQRCAPSAPKSASSHGPRLVILGFDGLDPRRVHKLIGQGRLPHMAALGEAGHRGPLGTTNPPQSPVAWATFATGAPPGTHGIFDFVQRDAKTYLPAVATTRMHHAEVAGDDITAAWVENLRAGDAFWDVIARGGVPVRTLSVPYAYPTQPGGAHALAGLGTPDLRGTNSSFTWLTGDPNRLHDSDPAGGQMVILRKQDDASWTGSLAGPRLRVSGKMQQTEIGVRITAGKQAGTLHVALGGWEAEVAARTTSDYAPLVFSASPGLALHGTTRFTVRQIDPPDIYAEPLSMVPQHPYLPLSEPAGYAAQLWDLFGPSKTVGWSDDTSALGAGAMGEAQFLAEARHTMTWLSQALTHALTEASDRLVIAVFTSPDRIAHMFARVEDPRHPAYSTALAPFADAISTSYEDADAIVGQVQAKLRPEDTLVVMSDHGFATFARGFHINRWLKDQGFLRLHASAQPNRPFFADVDWAATRAYAFGTGSIFLNRQGREGQGLVTDAEAPGLVDAIIAKLGEVSDGDQVGIVQGYRGDTLFAGEKRPDAPDIRVGMADGYRASWATALGDMGTTWFEDNPKKWSGDHASSRPEDVPGILLSNRKVTLSNPRIEDLARTAYEFAGIAAPPSCIGRPLW